MPGPARAGVPYWMIGTPAGCELPVVGGCIERHIGAMAGDTVSDLGLAHAVSAGTIA